MHNNSSEETLTMDGSSDSLLKYPLIDPQWSSFNMLVEEANKIYYQRRSSIPCTKIMYHLNPKKTVKNCKNPSRTNLASNKPIYFMGSAVEGASSTLQFHLQPKKTVKNYANEVLKEHSFPKEEASKKPINSLGSASTEGFTPRKEDVIKNISRAESSLKEDDHVLKMKKRNGLKRTHEAFINDEENIDVLDQEWVPCESSNKKQKNSKGCSNSKRQNPKQLPKDATDTTTPDLPQEFKNKINEMGGNQITLVIQKSLYKTDLSPKHNRLSMPLKQIKNASFLREEELRVLEKKVIEVPLLQPSLELRTITLAKWDMPKLSSPTNSFYVLRSSWMKVALANKLEQNDVVQVWSFRVQEELYMALVKVQTINL